MSKSSFFLAIIAFVLYAFFFQAKTMPPEVPKPQSQEEEASSSANPIALSPSFESLTFRVERVVDGDTIEIAGGVKVRYIGIDTPESTTTTECFGEEAANQNKLLVEGREVSLEKDVSETDKYGRLLRYVYVEGMMVNQELVETGYANSSSYPPDIKYQELFRNSERLAREQGRGLWGSCGLSKIAPNNENNGCSIKGNISKSTTEKIYHVFGGKFYNQTVIGDVVGEKYFCSEAEAQAAGWRKSKL